MFRSIFTTSCLLGLFIVCSVVTSQEQTTPDNYVTSSAGEGQMTQAEEVQAEEMDTEMTEATNLEEEIYTLFEAIFKTIESQIHSTNERRMNRKMFSVKRCNRLEKRMARIALLRFTRCPREESVTTTIASLFSTLPTTTFSRERSTSEITTTTTAAATTEPTTTSTNEPTTAVTETSTTTTEPTTSTTEPTTTEPTTATTEPTTTTTTEPTTATTEPTEPTTATTEPTTATTPEVFTCGLPNVRCVPDACGNNEILASDLTCPNQQTCCFSLR